MHRVTWLLAALLAISGIVSTNLWHELRSERALSGSLRAQRDDTVGRLRAATSAPKDAVIANPALPPTASAETQPIAPAPSKVLVDPVAAVRKAMLTEQELWKDADYRKARLAQIRSTIGHSYPGIAEELDLSTEETERLFDLLAGNQMNASASSITLTADGQPDPEAVAEMMRQRQESQRSLNESLQAMLGSRFAQWQAYQPTRTARIQAISFSTQLAQAGQPLSSMQLRSLTAAMVAEQRTSQSTPGASTTGLNPRDPEARAQIEEITRKRQEENNRRTMEAAAPYLNAQQLGILKTQFEQQVALSRAATKARERVEAAR